MFFKTLKVYIKMIAGVLYYTPRLKTAEKINEEQGEVARIEYICDIANRWSAQRVKDIGANLTVEGLENIPNDRPFVLIANHQSNSDIFYLLGTIGRPISLVAKAELGKIPVLVRWLKAMGGLLMDRSDLRQSMQTILNGIKLVKQGISVGIFPEGTRNDGKHMLEFKGGSFKLATKTGAPILPLTIEGTHRLMEDNNGWIKTTDIKLTYHPIIETKGMSKDEQNELPERVHKIIESALKEDDNIGKVIITKEYIEKTGGPVIMMRGCPELEEKSVI